MPKSPLRFLETTDYPVHREQMLALHLRSYGWDGTALYDSNYLGNPLGEPRLALCYDGDTLVGQENYLMAALAWGGEVRPAAINVDTMVDKRYRLLTNVFAELARRAMDRITSEVPYLFAFPNDAAKKYYTRDLGWSDASERHKIAWTPSPEHPTAKVELERLERFETAEWDPFLAAHRARQQAGIVFKSVATLNWKYLANRNYRIHGYRVRSQGTVRGYALLCVDGADLKVIEITLDGPDAAVFRGVLTEAARLTAEQGVTRIVVGAGPGTWHWPLLDASASFHLRQFIVWHRPGAELPPGWSLQLGDGDVF